MAHTLRFEAAQYFGICSSKVCCPAPLKSESRGRGERPQGKAGCSSRMEQCPFKENGKTVYKAKDHSHEYFGEEVLSVKRQVFIILKRARS